ncbi:acyl-CoA desaturase [Gloeobacter morelensis]|uniref:Acyl-CoA desaturase n=1 Tax=Gloeobacter morelensis MG652769 TaxID=2781736 RepID=A0ABY3PMB5_9CYAN|nr:acyl-CoA desaturase [Gloeobacter morelensis]UFP94724.1 acyl-CoA desaturase [Gloeobacter morelensis MG652769]
MPSPFERAMQSATPASSLPWQKTIIKSTAAVRNAQRLHALAILSLPAVATAAAAAIALRSGLGLLELGLFLGMYTLTMVGGITVGFHRHFTHCAFQAHPIIRVLLAVLGSMACEGPLIYWVSNHRRHHQYSDRPGDVHSPYIRAQTPLGGLRGFWHAHIGWTFDHDLTNATIFARDLIRDPLIARISRLYYLWVALGLLLPALLGAWWTRDPNGALLGLLWGGGVRLFCSYHFTNSINSVTHLFGSRPFETGERSTNNPWLALPTGGESWHNNHHAFPNSAVFGLQPWQPDPGAWLIRLLEKLGLAREVKVPSQALIAAKAVRPQPTRSHAG